MGNRARAGRWSAVLLLSLATGQATSGAIQTPRIQPEEVVKRAAPIASPENEALQGEEPGARFTGARSDAPAAPAPAMDLTRVAIALVAIVGMIFGLRWVAGRVPRLGGGARGGRGVRLLTRTVLAPKQHVLLLHVGRRVLVVGDSAGVLRPLGEITDPDEVASLVGQAGKEPASPERSAASFGSLFGRAKAPFEEAEVRRPLREPLGNLEPVDAASQEEVGGLLERVRSMRQQFNQP